MNVIFESDTDTKSNFWAGVAIGFIGVTALLYVKKRAEVWVHKTEDKNHYN